MIVISSLALSPSGDTVANYTVSFQVNHEKRDGTTVAFDLKMTTRGGATVLTGDFGECLSTSPEAALDKLAFWFESFAKELREKKIKTTIPVFGS